MVEKTCAACDCKLDINPIKVRIAARPLRCAVTRRAEAEGSARFRDSGEERLSHGWKQTIAVSA